MTHSEGLTKDLQSKADPERWMRWLLSFCQINLRQLSNQEWIGLKSDLHALCQSSSPFDFAQIWRASRIAASPKAQFEFEKGQMRGLRTRRDILTVQKILKEGLTQLYPKQLPTDHDKVFRVWKVPASVPEVYMTRFSLMAGQRIRKKAPSRAKNTKSAFSPQLRFYPKWPDLFWLAVLEIIEQCGPQLRQCEECKTLFLRNKRQTYCSEACSQRVRSRKWYKKHGKRIKMTFAQRLPKRVRNL
jgi:hypothetical protein